MDTDDMPATALVNGVHKGPAPAGILPELEAYAFLLVITYHVDRKQYSEVRQ